MFKKFLFAGYKLIALQLLFLSIVVIIFILRNGWGYLPSVLLGGGAWIIPSVYFVHKLFNSKTKLDPKSLLKNLLLGEAYKLLLSTVLIILIIKFFDIKVVAFLSGYASAVISSFLLPLWATEYCNIKQQGINKNVR